MKKTIEPGLTKKSLPLAIGCIFLSLSGYAQDGPTDLYGINLDELGSEGILLEEVVVWGVRASQAKAIDVKRNSSNIVDSIVTEDIGKLPDLTITDSLQRITGVQITREANEGTTLNVRGMPQVLTTLNGEQFLSPWSITNVGANYTDIPAGMISRVDVLKSAGASTLDGGISGIVDLQTYRPTEMETGWMGTVKIEGSRGEESDFEYRQDGSIATRSPDTNLSIFTGYNHNDRWGFTLGGFRSSTYAANYQMYEDQRLAFLDQQGGTPGDPLDLNGNGDRENDWYLVPAEFGARSNFVERDREGISLSVESKIGDRFSVKGDLFYTRMDQYDRGVRASFKGQSSALAYQEQDRYLVNGEYVYYAPGETVDPSAQEAYNAQEPTELYNVLQPGSVIGHGLDFSYLDRNGVNQSRTLYPVLVAEITSPEFQAYSTNEIDRTAALNASLLVEYTNQQNLEVQLRYVKAEAEHQARRAELQQGSPAWLWLDADRNQRKDRLNAFDVTVDYRGEVPAFQFDDNLSSPDLLQYYQAQAGGETTNAKLDVLRADVTYIFENMANLETLDFGFRHGVRRADHYQFHYVTPTARYSTWNDPRVDLQDRYRLREGNAIWQRQPEWRRYDYELEDSNLINPEIGGMQPNGFSRDSVITFNQFGPISGFENGVSALNPATWDAPLAFMDRLYPGTRTVVDPSYDYSVNETSLSTYAQLNFNSEEGFFGVPFQGNVGVRVVRTEREVTRSVIPEVLDRTNSIGYSGAQQVAFVSGKETIDHSYTDLLPSLNLRFTPMDDLVARFSMSRTTSRNDLNNVGSSLSLQYQPCNKTELDENGNPRTVYTVTPDGASIPEVVSCVSGGSDTGSPDIKPWRADVYNTSLEWYFNENAILAAGLFLINVGTSVETTQEQRSFADADGVDRGHVANIDVSRNVGASDLYGLELGYKHPWSFLDVPVLDKMGMEFNYTYSESSSNDRDIEGKAFPLPSNSKHQTNLILWYDDQQLNVRLAYNWRSAEFLGRVPLNTNETPLSLGNWIEPTGYLDLSVNYWLTERVGLFFNANNLTETHRVSYSQFESQFHSLWAQERRYSGGITIKL